MKTAVQAVFAELEELHPNLFNVYTTEGKQFVHHFHKYIAMEREQIIEARNNGFLASGEGWNGEYGIEDLNLLTQEIKSEEYYNETFKSE